MYIDLIFCDVWYVLVSKPSDIPPVCCCGSDCPPVWYVRCG